MLLADLIYPHTHKDSSFSIHKMKNQDQNMLNSTKGTSKLYKDQTSSCMHQESKTIIKHDFCKPTCKVPIIRNLKLSKNPVQYKLNSTKGD